MAQNQNQGKQGKGEKTQDLNQLRKVRREKLANLVAEGKNPFEIVTYDQTQHTQEIKDNYEAFEGKEVSVMGSGMGMPSFTLYAFELFHFFGVEAIIRIGSAGGIRDDVHVRDLIIAMSASTNSTMATSYALPGVMAPTATYELLREAVRAADELGVHARVGTVYTSDFFYHPDPEVNQKAKSLGHLAVEMEAAGLYLTAMAAGKKALALFQISDHVFSGESLPAAERQDSFHEMMEVALRTAARADI